MTAPRSGATADAPKIGSGSPGPVRMRRGWQRLSLNANAIILIVVAAIVAYLALVPLATLLISSFQSGFLSRSSHWTLGNFQHFLSSPIFYRLLGTSLIYAGCTAVAATVMGVGLGWLYARSDMPAKKFAFVAVIIPFIIPGVLYAIAWILLCSPRIGIYNVFLQALTGHTLFNIYSLQGMILVEALHNAPLAFLMSISVFSSIDASLEEAASIAGYGKFGVFREITLKLAWPGILGALLLIFIRVISSFEVAQLIGTPAHIFVFVSQIYAAIQSFPPNYGQASVIGDVLLVLCVGGLYISNRTTRNRNKYATITGKNFKPGLTGLGKWRWPCAGIFMVMFLTTALGPLLAILWSSLLPAYQVPSMEVMSRLTFENYLNLFRYPDIAQAVVNSVVAALATGVITMILTTFAAYITVKSRAPGRWLLDLLVFVPIAMPGIIIGIGILFWYLVAPLPFSLYGTLTLLIIAFVTTHIPYGMRYMTTGMIQINDEMEEAGLVAGAVWFTVFRKIYLPLLMPSLLAGFVYTVITVFREVSTAIFLYSPNSQILSIAVYTLWENGAFPMAAALGVLIVLLVLVLFGMIHWISKRRGVSWSI
ncbi:MAG: iron(III) transport system permease protein [Gammaproteobacteria bacterium]|nr:iron(III) transport system permease protein [Gammaproteobacteria bacterium]